MCRNNPHTQAPDFLSLFKLLDYQDSQQHLQSYWPQTLTGPTWTRISFTWKLGKPTLSDCQPTLAKYYS